MTMIANLFVQDQRRKQKDREEVDAASQGDFVPMHQAIRDQAEARGFDFDNKDRNWMRRGQILEQLIDRGDATSDQETEFRMGVQIGRYQPRDREKWGQHIGVVERSEQRQEFTDQYGLTPEEVQSTLEVKRSRADTFSSSLVNNVTLGNADNMSAFINRVGSQDSEVNRLARKMRMRGVKGDTRKMAAQLIRLDQKEDNPLTSMAGEIAGFMAPGVGIYGATSKVGGRMATAALGRQSARMIPTGTTLAEKASRYGALTAREATYGFIDGAVWGATVGMSDARARKQWDESVADPDFAHEAWMGAKFGALFGGLMSPAARTLRASGLKIRGKADFLSEQAWVPNNRKRELARNILIQNGATFDDLKKVEGFIKDGDWESASKIVHDPAYKSAKIIMKRIEKGGGIDAVRQKMRDGLYGPIRDDYDHMLMEYLAEVGDDVRGLGQALTTVDGPAKQLARESYNNRDFGAPARIRRALNNAFEMDADDFYANEAAARQARRDGAQPLYDEAYDNTLSDEDWARVVRQDGEAPAITSLPAFGRALDDAIGLGRNLARTQADLDAVLQLERLKAQIAADGGDVNKISVRALQLIDQTLTKANKAAMKPDAPPAVLGSGNVQRRLRDATDTSSGLAKPREFYKKAKDAETAFSEARKMAKDGVDPETLDDRFAGKDDQTRTAVIMGYLRGLDDAISTSGTGLAALRRLYRTDRQKQKLHMMLDEAASFTRAAKEAAKAELDEAVANRANNIEQLRDAYNKAKAAQARTTMLQKNLFGGEVRGTGGRVREIKGVFEMEDTFAREKNEMIGGSQTHMRQKATEMEDRYASRAEEAIESLFNPLTLAKKTARFGARRIFRSIIYDKHANKQLGEWLFGQASEARRKAAQRAKRKGQYYAPEDLARTNKERYEMILRRIEKLAEPSEIAGRGRISARVNPKQSASDLGVATKQKIKETAEEIADSGRSQEAKRMMGFGLLGLVGTGMADEAYADGAEIGDAELNGLLLTVGAAVLLGMRAGGAAARGRLFKKISERAAKHDVAPVEVVKELSLNGMFVGEKAKLPNSKIDVAKRLIEQGADWRKVKYATGWFEGADGKWRYQLPDAGVQVKRGQSGDVLEGAEAGTLGDLIDHPALFDAYPGMRDVPVRFSDDGLQGGAGGYSPSAGEIILTPKMRARGYTTGGVDLPELLVEEIQHVIQWHEGFESGGNPAMMAWLKRNKEAVDEAITNSRLDGDAKAEARAYFEEAQRRSDIDGYGSTRGELEADHARAAYRRSNDERGASSPLAEQRQIVEARWAENPMPVGVRSLIKILEEAGYAPKIKHLDLMVAASPSRAGTRQHQFEELIIGGKSADEAAADLDVSGPTLRAMKAKARRNGVDIDKGAAGRPIDPDADARSIEQMAMNGTNPDGSPMSYEDIADEMLTTVETVNAAVQRARARGVDIPYRAPGRRRELEVLSAMDFDDDEIARKARNTIKDINRKIRKDARQKRLRDKGHLRAINERVQRLDDAEQAARQKVEQVIPEAVPYTTKQRLMDAADRIFYNEYGEPTFIRSAPTYAFVSSPVWVTAAWIGKSWLESKEYANEQRFKRDLEEMYRRMDEEFRRENGLPPTPSLKPENRLAAALERTRVAMRAPKERQTTKRTQAPARVRSSRISFARQEPAVAGVFRSMEKSETPFRHSKRLRS